MKNYLLIILILLLAFLLRTIGVNWDQGHFLHPDERFLNMVVQELSLPESFTEYFDPQLSKLNPRNFARNFFVYGNLPISLNKLINEFLNLSSLAEITITGRVLSAIADLLIIPFIYLTVLLLENNFKNKKLIIHPQVKWWASLVYALSVVPIQQAHFFTTDTFLNLFVFTSFYFSLNYFFTKKFYLLVIAGLFSGFALASKVSGIFIIPLNIVLLVFNNLWQIKLKADISHLKIGIGKSLFLLSIYFLSAYMALRLGAPYMFEHASFLKISLNNDFINNLKELKSYESSAGWFPPAIQWFNRSMFFGLKNLLIYGVGIVISFFSSWGIISLIANIVALFKRKKISPNLLIITLILFWITSFLIYYSQQIVQSMRYYLIIYPFIAIFSAMGIVNFLQNRRRKLLWSLIVFLSLTVWPLMFVSIYINTHSRIQASEWIYQNIPADSMILVEHWDDALPVALANYPQQYELYQLPVFAIDDEQKWIDMQVNLAKADYYILSSNRAWGSILRVPDKYPVMSKFYQDLLANKTAYQLIAKFTSYPNLEYLGFSITFDDSMAEEAFTVYDHPEVLIFQKK